jgi:hypothetical protein
MGFGKNTRSVDGLGDGLGGNSVAGRRLGRRGSSDGLSVQHQQSSHDQFLSRLLTTRAAVALPLSTVTADGVMVVVIVASATQLVSITFKPEQLDQQTSNGSGGSSSGRGRRRRGPIVRVGIRDDQRLWVWSTAFERKTLSALLNIAPLLQLGIPRD